MALTKLVGKTFTVCRKSIKTVKVFSHPLLSFTVLVAVFNRLSKQRISVINVC